MRADWIAATKNPLNPSKNNMILWKCFSEAAGTTLPVVFGADGANQHYDCDRNQETDHAYSRGHCKLPCP
jgi:hypothetical protein